MENLKEESMRALAACILSLGLAVSPALAATGNAADKDPAAGAASSSAPAATANAAPAPKAEASSSEISAELQQLRELLESQAKQLQQQQARMELLEEQLHAANAASLAAAPAGADPAGIGPATSVAASSNTSNLAASQDKKSDEPIAIHYKGVTITPGGFMAAETVWRQKALSADVNTPFNSAPFNGASQAHMTEWNTSGRQSRFSLLTEGKLDTVKIGGYYETDFLSSGTTSNDNQSNSYTLRMRQFWGQAAFTNGITVTGGQQWSLLTETTKGMDNRTEALPMVIDAQYNIGFSWARQFGFRVTKNFGNKFWLGASIEEAQSTVTVHGNPTTQTATTTLTCTTPGTNGCSAGGTITINLNPTFNNFLVGAFGASGGLYNPLGNYAYNRAPDFIFKAVWEPGFGHYEVFGLVSDFRDRAFPCVFTPGVVGGGGCNGVTTSAFGAFNDSRVGGGGGANARWALRNKKIDVGVHFLGGTGIGRYGSGGLPDLTVRPDGTLVPLRNYQALGTLQFHPVPKLDIYMNVGGEYSTRAGYIKSGSAPNEGYGYQTINNSGCWTETLPLTGPSTSTNLGVPTGVGGTTGFIPGPLGSCTGDTRNLIEGTLGFWYRFYSGPKGRVQFGMQYSNYVRNTWRGAPGTSGNINISGQPHSDENMIFTSFRYYLP
jgi:hypothetical protein